MNKPDEGKITKSQLASGHSRPETILTRNYKKLHYYHAILVKQILSGC